MHSGVVSMIKHRGIRPRQEGTYGMKNNERSITIEHIDNWDECSLLERLASTMTRSMYLNQSDLGGDTAVSESPP
jgi:hypothetical protein